MLLYEKKMTEPAETLEQVQKPIFIMLTHITLRLKLPKLKTGSIFEGRLNDEFKFCMAITEM